MQPNSIHISREGFSLPPPTTMASGGGASFASALGEAIAQVEAYQQVGDRQASALAAGGGNLHETALALETADIAMRAALKVRNKLVDAYQEIMRMNL